MLNSLAAHSYKNLKRPVPDTSVSSEAQPPCKSDKHKLPKKKAAKKGSLSTPKKGSNPKIKTEEGPPTSKSSPPSDLPLDHWVNHCPGDGAIPVNPESLECEGGLVLFQGTRHHPVVSFEAEQQARRQAGHQLRLWLVELINHGRQSLDASRMVEALISPRPSDLPRLPPWAAPNLCDYWGRPWAYFDAPSDHSEVGVSSKLTPPSTRVTVAVLVDCPHEPQFLPDMVIAQSASVAAGRATCQMWPFTQNCEIQDNLKLEVAVKRLLPRRYGDGYSAAVLDHLKAWETFRRLGVERRENPLMPTRDVTPPGCPRTRYHSQASGNFSRHQVVTARVAETK